jgi:hypothetical protein
MFRRVRLVPTLLATATVLVAAAAIASACGGGNPYGSCVTYYTDGDVYRYSTDKAYCEESCEERIANSDNIASCYFEGARAAPLEP